MTETNSEAIKYLITLAWRERWNEVEWGRNIKRALPRGVSGDVYDMADQILKEALVGPVPNDLLMGYLRHSISSKIVSYGAVLTAISQYEDLDKPDCLSALLELVVTLKDHIGCTGNEEECVCLCKSIVSLSAWLFACLSYLINELNNLTRQANTATPETQQQAMRVIRLTERSAEMIAFIATNSMMRCLFFIGQREDNATFSKLSANWSEIESKRQLTMSALALLNNHAEVAEPVLNFLEIVQWNYTTPRAVVATQLKQNGSLKRAPALLLNSSSFTSIATIIAFEALLSPVNDISICTEKLMLVSKFNDLPNSDLYFEIIRACFVGLVDSGSTVDDLKWAAFTFLKAPQILVRINSMRRDAALTDIQLGLEKLLTFTPLLDLTDSKSNCDCLKLLLTELSKAELLDKNTCERILLKRQNELSRYPQLQRPDSCQSGQAAASLIARAEPTVTTILKTLDSDYSKNQDALLKAVLCPMLNGKSFQLILNAAAATGKLQSFVEKLVKYNELNKQSPGEGGKASLTRAYLFDITFLMLCHIAQNYGSEIITDNVANRDSFFASWCAQCLPASNAYPCPDLALANCDPNRVDILLNQFASAESEFKTSLVKWSEVCHNAIGAIKEVLLAWEHGSISTDNVKLILDNIKSKMCCLPVVISAWLCSYINVLHHKERLKPMNMLQQFMTPLASDANVGSGGGGGDQLTTDSGSFYKERSSLMATIIKKMLYDLHPPQQTGKSKTAPIVPHGLTTKVPLGVTLENTFVAAQTKTWLDLKGVHNIDLLLSIGGPNWFVESIVGQVLSYEHVSDLDSAIALAYGLFHLDIEQCALSLLSKVLPSYLLTSGRQVHLFEPKSSALARLTVMTTVAALSSIRKKDKSWSKRRVRRKHSKGDGIEPMDVDLILDPLPHHPSRNLLGTHSSRFEDTPFACGRGKGGDEKAALHNLDPFTRALASFLLLISSIISDSGVSQRTLFPLVFLEQLILCTKDEANEVLQFLPHDTIMGLIKTTPDSLTQEFLLAIGDLSTKKSRTVVAKALCQLKRAQRLLSSRSS